MSAADRLDAIVGEMTPGPWAISSAKCRCCWVGPLTDPTLFEGPDTDNDGNIPPDAASIVALRNAAPVLVALVRAAEGMLEQTASNDGTPCQCDWCSGLIAAVAELEKALG